MANIIATILFSIGSGFLVAIPALILGYWLGKTGKAPNRSLMSLLFCIVLTFVNQIWFPSLSFGWFALITIVGSTLGVYRMDLYWASKRSDNNKNTGSYLKNEIMSENSINIRVRLDFVDVLRANNLFLTSKVPNWLFVSLILGAFFLLYGVSYWKHLLAVSFDPNDNVSVILSFAIAGFMCLSGVTALLWTPIKAALLWLSFKKNSKLYSEPYQVIFDDTGMAIKRKNSNAKYEWNFFKEILEGRHAFILLYGKDLYFTIPKKSFESESDLIRFRDLVNLSFVRPKRS